MSEYHSLVRRDALRICPPGQVEKVLEVGCGTGETLAHMKQTGLAKHVTGVEREPSCAESANPILDEYLTMDAEEFYPQEEYGAILLLDVLEHLVDPFAMLKRFAASLAPGGYMLVSIPNIRNLGILKDLIFRGEWEYRDFGILDRTHLRFFTHDSFLRAATLAVPDLRLQEYASNDESHPAPWKWLLALPHFRELGVCQHLFRFTRAI